jgi:hypothetical protein
MKLISYSILTALVLISVALSASVAPVLNLQCDNLKSPKPNLNSQLQLSLNYWKGTILDGTFQLYRQKDGGFYTQHCNGTLDVVSENSTIVTFQFSNQACDKVPLPKGTLVVDIQKNNVDLNGDQFLCTAQDAFYE